MITCPVWEEAGERGRGRRRRLARAVRRSYRERYLRPEGTHCPEWWWCQSEAGHPGPCPRVDVSPEARR